MQTKQQIEQLLASAGVEPNKRLGQNFLIDLNLMRLLVDSANIGNDDIVLEVGCGTGSLTQGLAERAGKVIAVELDKTLAKIAARELANAGNVEVINADILENKNTINRTISDAIELARKKLPGKISFGFEPALQCRFASDDESDYKLDSCRCNARYSSKGSGRANDSRAR